MATQNGAFPAGLNGFGSSLAALNTFVESATILLVDSEEINIRLLRGILRTTASRVLECSSGTEAIEIIENEPVDLIIVDMMLPGMSGPELCRRLKTNRRTQLIPVLMLTSVHGIENEIEGLSSGADEFLLKPLHPAVVRARIRAMLRNKAITDSLDEAESILFSLAQAVEARDECTGQHCVRLAQTSVQLGEALGLSRDDLLALYRGAYLHDIGKISVPDAILFKRGSLTEDEWKVMRLHPITGEEICCRMKSLAPVLPIIRHHHERLDGSGYPDGLKGEEVPLLARILQISDIYDALVTERPYKRALSSEEAIRTLEKEAQLGWRDGELVALFADLVQNNTFVSLSNMRAALSDPNYASMRAACWAK